MVPQRAQQLETRTANRVDGGAVGEGVSLLQHSLDEPSPRPQRRRSAVRRTPPPGNAEPAFGGDDGHTPSHGRLPYPRVTHEQEERAIPSCSVDTGDLELSH